MLSSALKSRTHSIENLSLNGNWLGNREVSENFDTFIDVLNKNSGLKMLSLMAIVLGMNKCSSLARLLKNLHSKLKSLILQHNCIGDTCASILAGGLTDNRMLTNMDLDRNKQITAKGLMGFLQLIRKT